MNEQDLESLEFILKHGIEADVSLAVELIEKHFATEPKIKVDYDPEDEDEHGKCTSHLVLEFYSVGTVEETLARYDELKNDWVKKASQNGMIKICFCYWIK